MSAEIDCEVTEALLRRYLTRCLGLLDSETNWTLKPSHLGGRGVFATRDLAPGDVIFHDRAVVCDVSLSQYFSLHPGSRYNMVAVHRDNGPRAKPDQPMCASCYRRGRVSKCASGCYLPICSPECAIASEHTRVCRLLQDNMRLPEDGWRLDLLGTVTPLHCLFLETEDREVLNCLQGNQGKIHGIEVDLLKYHMGNNLRKEDEEWMRHCCYVMDTNIFEYLKVFSDGSQTSLRGLYPLAAMLNNECSPNSCHVYDSQGVMKVFASRPIAAGEEISTSYSALLWSTNIRRMNLARTKHFLCRCSRCVDPTEFGSMLSCLPCTDRECRGLLLPSSPLRPNSPWFCGSCTMELSPKEAAQLQAGQGSLLQSLAMAEPSTAAHFLTLQTLPTQSQVVVQLKNSLIWDLGHKAGFSLEELSDEILDLKEKCCRDLLQVLETLRLGYCRMKGLIMLELHASLCEQHRRLKLKQMARQGIEAETHDLLTTAKIILRDDASAEKKLTLRVQEQLQMGSSFP